MKSLFTIYLDSNGFAPVHPLPYAKKSIALVSGHCHAYEHFEIQGRAFLVSGGWKTSSSDTAEKMVPDFRSL